MAQQLNRSDGFKEKLALLQTAYDAGRMDLALSVAASMRDTFHLEKQVATQARAPNVQGSHSVRQLPVEWAKWARGWAYYTPVSVHDTLGIERSPELMDLSMSLAVDQISDAYRELRVARVEGDGSLREVPCQIYDVARSRAHVHCHVTFFASAPLHSSSTYLIFHGNPHAELPEYASDLKVTGEGYGLDVENDYYRAVLSRQMGQLERLTIKREHGLELYAGGKGHGEPPHIDWAHDYVDEGHFQKLRMRNWPQCPNYETERGPLFVRVRRWGFPYSPIHPLYVPSRVHIDQTYTFLAGLPYFFKHGTMEAVQDVAIEAMRDDEWVLSGYSFTDLMWVDEHGRTQLGAPPPEAADRLWGIGFFHKDSHDAFVALWLKHEAQGFDAISHSGSPTMNYAGHGQIWSRYPAHHAVLKTGTVFHQHNAYVVLPISGDADRQRIEHLRHQLLNPVQIGWEAEFGKATNFYGSLARLGETPDTATRKAEIWAALNTVKDEQLYKLEAGIVDLGYVYDVRFRDGVATVVITMPHRGRPVYDFLVFQGGGRVSHGIRETLLQLPGIQKVLVEFTWNPPWSIARLSPKAREELAAF